MANKWIDSLKKFNGPKSQVWSVPKKGTPQYDYVKRVMNGVVSTQVREIEKKTPKVRNTMLMSL